MPRCFRHLYALLALCGAGVGVLAESLDREERTLAFPGAEGFGRFASGGRGGQVIAVTNLHDAGPGSLRAAIETKGPRTIIFRVGGTILLDKPLHVRQGDLTIAGETAPGDGITIARRSLVVSETDNVIIRFIRVRLGDGYPRDAGLATFQEDAFECRYATNVIVDHCSFSWGIDETATIYQVQDTTIQWCFITESLNDSFHAKGSHGFGGIWGGDRVSFHHNLLASHRSRLPRFNGARYGDFVEWGDGLIDHRNNVIYNWGRNNAYGGEPHPSGYQARYNLVGNYYKPGPASRSALRRLFEANSNADGQFSRFHLSGNTLVGAPQVSSDNARGLDGVPDALLADVLAAEPFAVAPVQTDVAVVAYERVLALGGSVVPRRDSVDTRIVGEVRDGTSSGGADGLIDSLAEIGGYPAITGGEAPLDTDGDGLPDVWETARGLDPEDDSDGARPAIDGSDYTFLELYLHSLAASIGPLPDPQS